LKKLGILVAFFFTFLINGQTTNSIFQTKSDSLKAADNFAEFIYVQLDAFAKNPSVQNLEVFDNISANLWRKPINQNEFTAQLYLHINNAYYLKQFGFLKQAVLQYEKAYSIYKEHHLNSFDIIEFCLKPLANNYTRLGEVDRAEDIIKITIEKAQKEHKIAQIIAGYSNLAAVCRTKGAYKTAIDYLNLGINLSKNKQVKSKLLTDVAINYLFLNEVDKAVENIQLSNILNVTNDESIVVKNHIALANCWLQQNNYEKALLEFQKSLKNTSNVFGERGREIAKVYTNIAVCYGHLNQSEKALKFYQDALRKLIPNYQPKTLIENPDSNYFYPENTLKEIFDGRANQFIIEGDLENAIKNYELAFKVEAILRASYVTQNSKIIQQQENRNRSEVCIDLCDALYLKTKNKYWIEKAFLFAEQSKSVILQEANRQSFIKSKFKNDSLFLAKNETNFRIAQVNNSIVQEELKGVAANTNILSKLTKERFDLTNKTNLLEAKIQQKYSNLGLNHKSEISLKKLKDSILSKNELLIEFFDGKKNVSIFYIEKGKSIKMKRFKKDATFKKVLADFLAFFSDGRGSKLQNNVAEYTDLGYKLYQKLVDGALQKYTIIIPDGLFSFIPFDALITEQTTSLNFDKLPYLLHKSILSYAYSATIFTELKSMKNTNTSGFIGFFPVFENNPRNLATLNYTLQEANSIKKEVKGAFLISSKATKKNFTNKTKNKKIIHLSTHASSGDYEQTPSIEFYDETLYLPEIYGYNLNADLMVLSACETGLGTLRKGEGAMSLARGFMYAGVKNLIVSLWKVNDKATEIIMSDFYMNFFKSHHKSLSLHQAKETYLSSSEISSIKKSPYYWASFVYIGNVTPTEKQDILLVWLLILGMLVISGIILLKKM
jgi:CHAT domain-containing protein